MVTKYRKYLNSTESNKYNVDDYVFIISSKLVGKIHSFVGIYYKISTSFGIQHCTNSELRLAFSDEIAKYKLEQTAKKYNL